MIKLICVNGYPGSGKTTFEDFCIEKLGDCGHKISTIDFIKEICSLSGWNGEKTPETRAFLSEVKDLFSRAPWGDVPLMQVEKFCNGLEAYLKFLDQADLQTFYVFVDAREPDNIDTLKEKFDVITVLIVRPSLNTDDLSNHADRDVENYDYDYIISNCGSINYLKLTAEDFVKIIRGKNE